MSSNSAANPSAITATPERISELTATLLARIRGSIKEISEINLQARVLSINAQIEAARAGESGRAFAIVAEEMATFSDRRSLNRNQRSSSLSLRRSVANSQRTFGALDFATWLSPTST
jgi:methyl-accepting chemotaxis protein